jgi:DNA-binding NarL/FixJ family response regulator
MPRVLMAEDHPLFRDALRGVLNRSLGADDIVETGTVAELLALIETDDGFDLVMLDLFMPGAQGLSHLVSMRARMPDTPIISEITVKTHVTAILRKLRVTSRGQAIVMFQKRLTEDAI